MHIKGGLFGRGKPASDLCPVELYETSVCGQYSGSHPTLSKKTVGNGVSDMRPAMSVCILTLFGLPFGLHYNEKE